PEQIRAASDVDGRADIYALGVMSYQLLTGTIPFPADNPGAVVMAHLTRPIPDPREQNPSLPAGVSAAVMRAMSKKPDDRYLTAEDFAYAFVGQPVLA
ncbi:MAG: serine/threonine protein kinase, partial [Chloroflexi bacterium]|nr:serine/threonine protein kinase [Chloroflexota bacterium]